MTLESAIRHIKCGSEGIPQQLGAARDALVDSQREVPRGSVAWRAMRALIREIDALAAIVAGGQRSGALNLNAHSESHIKPRTSSRREGGAINSSVEAVTMCEASLEGFAEQVLKKDRIGKYDVEELRNDILVDGITSRAEAEFLVALDRKVGSVHFSWSSFFIAAVTDFVVWRSGEAGYIDEDKSKWLLAMFGEAATDRGRRALASIAKEAECFDEAFFAPSSSLTLNCHGEDRSVPEIGLAA